MTRTFPFKIHAYYTQNHTLSMQVSKPLLFQIESHLEVIDLTRRTALDFQTIKADFLSGRSVMSKQPFTYTLCIDESF